MHAMVLYINSKVAIKLQINSSTVFFLKNSEYVTAWSLAETGRNVSAFAYFCTA